MKYSTHVLAINDGMISVLDQPPCRSPPALSASSSARRLKTSKKNGKPSNVTLPKAACVSDSRSEIANETWSEPLLNLPQPPKLCRATPCGGRCTESEGPRYECGQSRGVGRHNDVKSPCQVPTRVHQPPFAPDRSGPRSTHAEGREKREIYR